MTAYRASNDTLFLRQTEAALINAPFEIGGWTRALSMLASATHSRGSNFLCLGARLPTLNLFTGYTQDEVQATFAEPELWARPNWRIGVVGRPLEIQQEEHYQAYRGLHPTGIYDDATRDIDMPFGCQTLFDRQGQNFVGVAVMRGRRDGPCTDQTITRFTRLVKLMHQAVRAEDAMAGEGSRIVLGEWESVSQPVLLVNRHRWLCGMSPSAETFLDGEGPFLLRGALLGLRDPGDHQRWLQLIGHMLGDAPTRIPATMHLRGTPDVSLRVVPLGQAGSELGFGPCLSVVIEPLSPVIGRPSTKEGTAP
jgi:hypothetical protein